MPSSKLSALCDKIIEAGWLSIVIATPLLVSLYTSRTLEPSRLAIVRIIAGIMVAAWLIQRVDRLASPRSPSILSMRTPLMLPTLILVAVYLMATLTSVAPRISFIGAYPRPEGTWTVLSYVVVFTMILQGLRARRQLNRLILAVILTSIPVAVYGLIQKCGLDPFQWSFSSSDRVGSTLGNPIFMGAYLIMVFSLTLGQIINSARAVFAEKAAPTRSIALRVRVAGYTLVGAVQAAAIVFSGSRGPWLGWVAGMTLFVLVLALMLRRRRWVLGITGLGMVGVAFLIALNLPYSPLAQLRDWPIIGRFTNVFSGTGEVRTVMWEGAARMMTPHAPLLFPDGTPDRLNLIRPLIGYGPDSLYLVSSQFATPNPFFREAVIDRNHNETWDVLVNTGLAGLLAYQFILLSFFLYGLRWLGLIPTPRERNLFIGLWAGLGLAGAGAAILLSQLKYLGVALPLGNAIGLVLYLVLLAFRLGHSTLELRTPSTDQILLVALLAGVLSHLIETQFGIAVSATRIMFWTCAAMLVVMGSGHLVEDTVFISDLPQPRRHSHFDFVPQSTPVWLTSVMGYAWIMALAFVTMLISFIKPSFTQSTTWPAILGMFLLIWAMAAIPVLSEISCAGVFKTSRDRWAGLGLFVLLPMGLALVFGLGLAFQLNSLPGIVNPTLQAADAVAHSDQLAGVISYYTISLILLMLGAALVLMKENRRTPVAWSSNRWAWIALVPVIVIIVVWTNGVILPPLRADVAHKLGQDYTANQQWDMGIALYRHAIRLAPQEDFYYMALGRAFQEQSNMASSEPVSLFDDQTRLKDILDLDAQQTAKLNRTDLLYAAQAMLTHARDLNPLYASHTVNLARFYLPNLPVDSPSKSRLADLADQYYAQAIRLSPNDATLWNEWAEFDLTYTSDSEAAIIKLKESVRVDPRFPQTYLSIGKAYIARQEFEQAAEAYKEALGVKPDLAEAQGKLAFLYYRQGKLPEAIQAYLKYIEMAPQASNVWEAHKNLALLYKQTGDLVQAIGETQMAARLAPSDIAPQLDSLVEQLRVQMNASQPPALLGAP